MWQDGGYEIRPHVEPSVAATNFIISNEESSGCRDPDEGGMFPHDLQQRY
jgi:hypothetical protein